MARPSRQPTKAELSILQVLWTRGPSTVRKVRDALRQDRPIGYTTVLKLLQIMNEKGLVDRDESASRHVYRARQPEDHTKKQLVMDLIDRAFDGSATKMVMQALGTQKASAEDLAEIRALLDALESGSG